MKLLGEKINEMDDNHWSKAENWCKWWTSKRHLRMVSNVFKEMEQSTWDFIPKTSNAVEAHNKMSTASHKGKSPLLAQLEHQYREDKLSAQKHVAASYNVSILSYSKTAEAYSNREQARAKNRASFNASNQTRDGPPDTNSSFNPKQNKRKAGITQTQSRKKKAKVDPLIGKHVSVECQDTNGRVMGWFEAEIETHVRSKGYLIRFLNNPKEFIYAEKVPAADIVFL